MPRGPKGEKRPADVISAGVKVMRPATGQVTENTSKPEDEGKYPAAVVLGKRGRNARAANLSKKRGSEIARSEQIIM
jgi:crotonobetainyl-CoA:carnitine CoA-transferase CaiB-like acyl-CoA transferase